MTRHAGPEVGQDGPNVRKDGAQDGLRRPNMAHGKVQNKVVFGAVRIIRHIQAGNLDIL